MIHLDENAVSAAQETRQQELSNRVQKSLLRLGYSELGEVRCCVAGEAVTLTGTLGSFYLKQIAQTVVAKVPGVGQIFNRIKIETPP